MAIKTFRGRTPAEALSQIKKELGPSAVILHTRTHRTGGFLGIGAHTVTEITAAAGDHIDQPTARTPRVSPRRSHLPKPDFSPDPTRADKVELSINTTQAISKQAPPPAHTPPVAVRQSAPSTRRSRELPIDPDPTPDPTDHPARTLAREAGLIDALKQPQHRQPSPDRITTEPRTQSTISLEREMELLKRMVGQVLQSTRSTRCGNMPEALEECYLRLLESEVAAEIADEIVGIVRDQLDPHELADREIVRRAVLRRLESLIPGATTPTPPERAQDDRPLTIALVGPTGVGKTTTIAKLAATYKLRHARKVGLVTSDTYRIAAVDQLRTYANIIGLPLQVALTPAEMAHACRSLNDCDVILIDSAGRSQHDQQRIVELSDFLAAASPHEIHLVLSSASGESVLRRAAERFTSVNPTHVIFTKLDEAVNFGVLVNVMRQVNAQLSFVTTGQEVPDQIEPASADRLARLVLDGGAIR